MTRRRIERLLGLTGSPLIAGAASLAFFVAVHATGWNLARVFGVALPLAVFAFLA